MGKLSDIAEGVKNAAGNLKDGIKDKIDDAKDNAKNKIDEVKKDLNDAKNEVENELKEYKEDKESGEDNDDSDMPRKPIDPNLPNEEDEENPNVNDFEKEVAKSKMAKPQKIKGRLQNVQNKNIQRLRAGGTGLNQTNANKMMANAIKNQQNANNASASTSNNAKSAVDPKTQDNGGKFDHDKALLNKFKFKLQKSSKEEAKSEAEINRCDPCNEFNAKNGLDFGCLDWGKCGFLKPCCKKFPYPCGCFGYMCFGVTFIGGLISSIILF